MLSQSVLASAILSSQEIHWPNSRYLNPLFPFHPSACKFENSLNFIGVKPRVPPFEGLHLFCKHRHQHTFPCVILCSSFLSRRHSFNLLLRRAACSFFVVVCAGFYVAAEIRFLKASFIQAKAKSLAICVCLCVCVLH